MSIRDCNNCFNQAPEGKCSCGPIHRFVKNRVKKKKGFINLPFMVPIKNPKICSYHRENPWCECRGKILCSQHTVELCWWSLKKIIDTGKVPVWLKEWLAKEPS